MPDPVTEPKEGTPAQTPAGDADPIPATPPTGDGTGGEPTFTQKQLDELIGTARSKGRESGATAILKDLGIEDLKTLKAVVTDHRESQQASMTELQKAQERVEELEGRVTTLEPLEAQNQEYADAITTRVDAITKDLALPDHVQELIDPMSPVQKLTYLTKHREALEPNKKGKTPNVNGANAGGSKTPAMSDMEKGRLAASLGIQKKYIP